MTRDERDGHRRDASPDEPLPDAPDDRGSAEQQSSVSPAREARPRERGEGANEEMRGDGLMREDDSPPGAG